jgi:hypothetical protein
MSAYLKKSIIGILFAISAGHAVDGYANNSSTDRERELETIRIYAWDSPYEIAGDAFDWTIDDYAAWESGTSEFSEGSGSDGDDSPPLSNDCNELRSMKPSNCPIPIPFPSGYGYGRDESPGGSGIPKLLYWIDFVGGVSSDARESARRALSSHTTDLMDEFLPSNIANQRLLLSVETACHLQHIADENNPWIIGTSHMEQKCIDVLERLQAEAGDPGFRGWFFGWLQREGIHLDDIGILESVVDWLAPSNSLRIKQSTIHADKKCAKWWSDVQANQCSL